MTKNVAAIFVAIMLLAQIGIAQHNIVHFTDHGYYEHGRDDDNHKKNASETCQICLLTKSLSLGLVVYHADLVVPVLSGHVALKNYDNVVNNNQYALYNSRASPALFV